jgi:molecular chaperone DnaJ
VSRERKLTVKIPPGIATGQRMRLSGEGEHGVAGGPPGDLYVVVHVKEHPFFKRDGDDLYCELSVAFPTLVLGGTIEVPTLDADHSLSVPAGTQTDTMFRLRGKGMANVSGRGQGDLFVVVKAAVPKRLTKEQKRLVEELGESLSGTRRRDDEDGEKPFFERVKDIFG